MKILTRDDTEHGVEYVTKADAMAEINSWREYATDLFDGPMRTALIFAGRYTHARNTGGTLAVVRALEQCWHVLDDRTRHQILRESNDAEYNIDDWHRLRDFAANVQGDARPSDA